MVMTPILPKRPVVSPPGDTNRRLRLRMATLVADLQRICANYEPPASPNYRRTKTLGRSWDREVKANGQIIGIVKSSGNVAPYNRWVRGPKTQTDVMKNRGWLTVKQILDEEWPDAKADFNKILRGKR